MTKFSDSIQQYNVALSIYVPWLYKW